MTCVVRETELTFFLDSPIVNLKHRVNLCLPFRSANPQASHKRSCDIRGRFAMVCEQYCENKTSSNVDWWSDRAMLIFRCDFFIHDSVVHMREGSMTPLVSRALTSSHEAGRLTLA